jgi:hypothetical protein
MFWIGCNTSIELQHPVTSTSLLFLECLAINLN